MGKPIFNAEFIKMFADGKEIEQRPLVRVGMSEICNQWTTVKDLHVFAYDHLEFRIKPPREYPKTSLSNAELMTIYDKHHNLLLVECLVIIANEAIGRYIDDQENKE